MSNVNTAAQFVNGSHTFVVAYNIPPGVGQKLPSTRPDQLIAHSWVRADSGNTADLWLQDHAGPDPLEHYSLPPGEQIRIDFVPVGYFVSNPSGLPQSFTIIMIEYRQDGV